MNDRAIVLGHVGTSWDKLGQGTCPLVPTQKRLLSRFLDNSLLQYNLLCGFFLLTLFPLVCCDEERLFLLQDDVLRYNALGNIST